MAIKKTVYQYCYCIGYERNSISNILKFFCYRVLPDGTRKDFIIYSTQINKIIYCNYDMGYGQSTYIHVIGEYYCFNNFDHDFEYFVDGCGSRNKIFEDLRVRYPNASITIFEDDHIDVWNNRMIECTE